MAEEVSNGFAVIADELDGHKQHQRALDDVDEVKRNAEAGLRRQSAVAQRAEDDGK